MPTKEERLRATLRARAWDLWGALPDGLDLEAGAAVEAVAGEGDVEVVITVRRKGTTTPAPGQERFLFSPGLSRVEQAVVRALWPDGNRRVLAQLREDVEALLGEPAGEGPLKSLLARMTDAHVGMLDNDRAARPPGYQLAPAYRAYLLAARPEALGAA